jgi:hypothetical protein
MKIWQKRKEKFLLFIVKQRFCNGITMLLKRYKNGTFATKGFRNGTETVHLQRNDSLQRIETGCETFKEKRFENYFATVSSGRNYIFVSGKV